MPGQGRPVSETSSSFLFPPEQNSSVWPNNAEDLRPKNVPQAKQKSSNPAFALARRCQGFNPITSDDIKKIEERYKDDNLSEEELFQTAGKQCVREFLRVEMNISKRVATDIRIKHVFFPKAGMATANLYAEFMSEEEVDIIKRNAKNLRTVNGHRARIIPYIPLSLFDRYKAVEEIAYEIRKKDRNQTTRLWISDDFELRVRERGSCTPWGHITPELLPQLPPQAPKKEHTTSDIRDKLRPITPRFPSDNNPTQSEHSVNIYNNLRETEA